jgi:hypothetical protein
MLKQSGEWEKLPDRERLFLLALAIEIRQTSDSAIHHCDVKSKSGLDADDFFEALHSLQDKGLIACSNKAIELAGDALTRELLGEKFKPN